MRSNQYPSTRIKKWFSSKALGLLLVLLANPWLIAQMPQTPQPAKRAFTIEDLYRVKYVSQPQISPHGEIAYTLLTTDLAQVKRKTHIYLMNADGGNQRQFTGSEKGDWEPRWSPNGETLAFLSAREAGTQIWLLPVYGGEAQRLTSLSTGISGLVWSPDGKQIAFKTRVYPECGANDAANREIDKAVSQGPIQAHFADRLLYRHWQTWLDGKRQHIFLVNVSTGQVRDLTPDDFDSPPLTMWVQTGYTFSPEGKELCYVSNREANPESSTNCDLCILPLDGGVAKNITAANQAYDGDPQYSPDGRYLAYRRQNIPGYEADCFRLALYDRRTGATRVLTETFDDWVGEFQWAPDSASLYFTADHRGYTPLFRVFLADGKITPVIPLASVHDFAVSPADASIVLSKSSIDKPVEIYRGVENRLTPLTSVNADLTREVDLRPATSFWVAGADGASIHVSVITPHQFDPQQKYPLILNVHGGPQFQWTDSFRGDWQVYPGAGYVVAWANPRGSTGYGQAFTEAISRDYGGKVFEDLMKVCDALEKLPYVDKTRMGAMGWSFGGYMINWFAGHTDRFRALASMMGVYDWRSEYGATEELWFPEWDFGGQPWNSSDYEKWSPSSYVQNFKTPCLVITGELDYRVPYTQSLEFFTALQKMGVPSWLIVFKNDGHWPDHLRSMPVYYNAHLEWFHRYLGGKPAPWDTRKLMRNQVALGKKKD